MLNGQGQQYWLIVRNKNQMEQAYISAYENLWPSDIIQNLKSRTHLLYFHPVKTGSHYYEYLPKNPSHHEDNNILEEHMHPAIELQGKKNIYWYSLVKPPSCYDFEKNKILSFDEYLTKI